MVKISRRLAILNLPASQPWTSQTTITMPQIEKNALVFGASGISGWSLMNQCLQYPSKDAFKSVTGLCNRPLSKQDACLPDDDRLKIISGVDLTQSVDTVTEQLKKIENIGSINIVFFCGKHHGSPRRCIECLS